MSPLFRSRTPDDNPQPDPRLLQVLIGGDDKAETIIAKKSGEIGVLLAGEACIGIAVDVVGSSVLVITETRSFVVQKQGVATEAKHGSLIRTRCMKKANHGIAVVLESSSCVYPALRSAADRQREGANIIIFNVRSPEDGFAICKFIDARI